MNMLVPFAEKMLRDHGSASCSERQLSADDVAARIDDGRTVVVVELQRNRMRTEDVLTGHQVEYGAVLVRARARVVDVRFLLGAEWPTAARHVPDVSRRHVTASNVGSAPWAGAWRHEGEIRDGEIHGDRPCGRFMRLGDPNGRA
jgi:hypothetical protein